MFFLGISANIMIYLLVPAFLIVCCYFNGKPESCEAVNNLMMATVFSPCEKEFSANETFFYGETIIQPEKSPENKDYYIPQLSPGIFLLFNRVSPSVEKPCLRAPPFYFT